MVSRYKRGARLIRVSGPALHHADPRETADISLQELGYCGFQPSVAIELEWVILLYHARDSTPLYPTASQTYCGPNRKVRIQWVFSRIADGTTYRTASIRFEKGYNRKLSCIISRFSFFTDKANVDLAMSCVK